MTTYLTKANRVIGERLIKSKEALTQSRLNGTKCKYVYEEEHQIAVFLCLCRYRANKLMYGEELAEQYKLEDIDTFMP